MPFNARYNHRINVFIGDFERALLSYAVTRDPSINHSDVFRDALRYYAWHHPGFDQEAFREFLDEYRTIVQAPPPSEYKRRRAKRNEKPKRRKLKPDLTPKERLAMALRQFDDEVRTFERRSLAPNMASWDGPPIDTDLRPLQDDLAEVEGDFVDPMTDTENAETYFAGRFDSNAFKSSDK
jgi:hypothetical protein